MTVPAGFSKRWPGGGLRYPGRIVGSNPGVYTPQDGDPLFLDNIQSAALSSGDESSGYLSDTNYKIESGAWRVRALASGEQYIECITQGVIYRRNLEAYNTWEFELYKAADGNFSTFMFSADSSCPGTLGTAGQPGYMLWMRATEAVQIREMTSSPAHSAICGTDVNYIAIATRYKYRITRSAGNVFTIYLKGGAFAGWTLLNTSGGVGTNPFTDVTVTASRSVAIDLYAGDRLYLDKQFEGVIAP